MKRIVVKIGTNVLSQPDGLLDITTISHLVDQVAVLKQQNIEVLLVSSGAVGAARSVFPIATNWSKVVRRQVLSAVGQVRLMQWYMQLFANHHLFCAQVLATKEDFRDRQHYVNMQNCLLALLRDNIVPVINENDVVSVSELMFTDNDELAGLVAAMTNADTLIILSTVDGLFNGDPNDTDSQLITEIDANDETLKQFILPSKSSFGRGGMHTKFRVAQKAANVGVKTIIANGKRNHILLDIANNNYVGTTFKSQSPVSNLKKWMLYTEVGHQGTVIVNDGAVAALRSKKQVSSLLPVGIISIEGQFEKGDIIKIQNQQGEFIGVGIAQYDAQEATYYLGQKGKKPLVHYDYLYIEEGI